MANCPHCNKGLDQDFLDSGMDELKNGISKNIFKAYKECLGCKSQIEFTNDGQLYYISKDSNLIEPIGGR
ncbi:hypothetical protein [Acinetobacter haemolyticus]|uniref:hypothetical protein n=1 Tax=Acinetobacter haemolyticus TaxID=29430 RepID=UPI001372ACC8|nr:hypothetical protein [Acinetobacter haemolyticus]NAR85840.1 hypothetical protein [Acinetobacter haemolyticus]NAR90717.1 hypothetical protein [Acinetobacter haemolyticus]